MEEGDSPVTIWEDLDNDILVKILQSFDVFELSAGLAHVCNAWRLACCDQLPLKTLDLSGLKRLKVLNTSHCIITEDPPPTPMKILTKLDESILGKASRLDKFLTLITDSCIKCQHTLSDEGLMRWYENEEDLWKVDEVRSLAI
ncbi:hypothetical protein MTR67_013212 [Solanum verrucosum]|uniref:F-box domain-containing protein n=1 Tax=Solanum verrucosum TaxID=315347 RepID=A0AAF0QA72_SOLVR|nr:hypothetical protein MTR67_013212 [Solanum verrucosum]